MALLPAIAATLDRYRNQSVDISPYQAASSQLTAWLVAQYQAGKTPALNFICTHNSRRSHLGQFWGAVTAIANGLPPIQSYSGGTEVTACHPNTIAVLQAAGGVISKDSSTVNPIYQLSYADDLDPLVAYSKLYDDPSNPIADFAAIMTCQSADEGCPFIAGASIRVAMPFTDPKHSDGLADQSAILATYDQTAALIASVLDVTFKQVADQLR